MAKKDLEIHVEKWFGVSLYEFLKQKVEEESLYDHEIGVLLSISGGIINRLRNGFGLKRSDGFNRRFELIYGAGAVETFKMMVENQDASLAQVARHFGFSREYARQVYKKIYGFPYTQTFIRKKRARRKKRLEAIRIKDKININVQKNLDSISIY